MRAVTVLLTWCAVATGLRLPVAETVSPRQVASAPKSFRWKSTEVLVGPKDDGRGIAGIKDPSVVEINGTYHVFASTAKEAGYNLVYFNFTDFEKAGSATFSYLDQAPLGTGYRAAPQVFYFTPQKLWYLVYQNGNAAYSTNPNIGDPLGWTAPKTFYSGMPSIVSENIGEGYWVDMWVICDTKTCHLFSSDDNGHLYRSETSIEEFPNGMSQPVIDLKDSNRFELFEAACVYTIGDAQYLLLIEAIGSDEHRYFRSWTSTSIAGPWEPLAATEANPFARANNVEFEGTPWTKSISHGEVIRDQTDQTLTIKLCDLRFLYQGLSPEAGGSYNGLPWRLGLLTQQDAEC
ncbi:hypothetical protein OQA88_6032 [Cercophora sp. LCS_1]